MVVDFLVDQDDALAREAPLLTSQPPQGQPSAAVLLRSEKQASPLPAFEGRAFDGATLTVRLTLGLGMLFSTLDGARRGAGPMLPTSTMAPANMIATAEVAPPIQPGVLLRGRYAVQRKLGEGRFGVVVLARDLYRSAASAVAIKIIRPDFAAVGLQEASTLARLARCPLARFARIVVFHHAFSVADCPCLVMECLTGKSVALAVNEAASLAPPASMPQDLKPENLLLESDDFGQCEVKLADFSNAISASSLSLYFDDFDVQAPLYRAPEVFWGVPFDARIDMWSLGCILCELYIGMPLFVAQFRRPESAHQCAGGDLEIDALDVVTCMCGFRGPFPRSPFERGKFSSRFLHLLRKPSEPTLMYPLPLQLLHNLLAGNRDGHFVAFVDQLLELDPNRRPSAQEAVQHPFLAPVCPFALLMNGDVGKTGSASHADIPPPSFGHGLPVRPTPNVWQSDIASAKNCTADYFSVGFSSGIKLEPATPMSVGHAGLGVAEPLHLQARAFPAGHSAARVVHKAAAMLTPTGPPRAPRRAGPVPGSLLLTAVGAGNGALRTQAIVGGMPGSFASDGQQPHRVLQPTGTFDAVNGFEMTPSTARAQPSAWSSPPAKKRQLAPATILPRI